MFLVDLELPPTHQKNPQSGLHSPKQNHILAALPSKVFERLLPHLKLVPLKPGSVLYEADSLLHYVYFPVDGIVSLRDVMKNGTSVEIAMIGNEGMVGISLSMGGKSTPCRAAVQSDGYAYRLDANVLDREFEFGGPLQHALLHYTHTLITMMIQRSMQAASFGRSASVPLVTVESGPFAFN